MSNRAKNENHERSMFEQLNPFAKSFAIALIILPFAILFGCLAR